MTEKKETKAEQPKLNLYQKLIEVRKQVEHLKKDAVGKGGKRDAPFEFLYTSGDSILSALRPKLDELNILVLCKIIDDSIDASNRAVIHTVYIFINADNPEERIELPWVGYGQLSDPSKSLGAALTYQERYFFKKNNLIPSDEDDPDAQPLQNGKSQKKPYQQKASPQPPPSSDGKKFDPISPELITKIKAACMYAGDGDTERAAGYYHLYADIMKDGKVDRKAPEVEKLSLKWAGNVWGKIKRMYEQNGWDIEVALHDFGGDSNAE